MATIRERLLERQGAGAPPAVTAPSVVPEGDPVGTGLLKQRLLSRRSEREVTAAQVGQLEADDPGLGELKLRFDLGLSDTFEEKKAKFLDNFPEGDFVQVDPPERTQVGALGSATGGGPPHILFRRNQEEDFTRLDAPGFELLGDLADISGDLPQVAMEVLLTRGAGLFKNMLQLFTGSVVGEGAKEAVEGVRGYQLESVPQIMGRAALEGLTAAGAGGATVVVSGPINALTGRGLMRIAPGAKEAQQAAQALDIPPLLPNQVANNPIIQKLGGQSASTAPALSDHVQRQNDALVNSLSRLRDPDVDRFLAGDLEQLHEDAQRQIIEAASLPNVSLTEGGSAIQRGITEYDNLARTAVDQAYKDARAIAEPEFDVAPLKAISAELRAGLHGEISPALEQTLRQIDELEPGVPARPVTLPDGETVRLSGTDQLRAIKQRLWDLKTPAPGDIARQPERQAGRAFGAIQNTLRRPRNAEPGFVEAWGRADKEAARRFDTMDKLMVVHAAKSETPAKLANQLVKPLQVDNVNLLREVLPENRFRDFQSAAKADMVAPNNVDRLTRRLKSFDTPTLNALFSSEDQRLLRRVGEEVDRLNNVGVLRALRRQDEAAAIVDDLVNTKSTSAINELVTRAGTDPNSQARKTLRAGIMENIFNRTVVPVENRLQVNGDALVSLLRRYRESGVLRLLSDGDRDVLRNMERVVDFIPTSVDTGASLIAGEAVSGATSLRISSLLTLMRNAGVGRAFTNPLFQRVALGVGKERQPFSRLRLLGGILGQVADDLQSPENTQPLPEE